MKADGIFRNVQMKPTPPEQGGVGFYQSLNAVRPAIETIIASLAALVDADSILLLLCQGEALELFISHGLDTPNFSKSSLGLSHHPELKSLFEKRQPVLSEHGKGSLSPLPSLDFPGLEKARSWMAVPVCAEGPVAAVLLASTLKPAPYGKADLAEAMSCAGKIAPILENIRLLHEALQTGRQTETAILLEIGREISSTLNIDDVLKLIVKRAHEFFTNDSTAVYLLDDENPKQMRTAAAFGKDAESIEQDVIEIGAGIIGSTALSGKPEIVDDLTSDHRAIHINGTDTESSGDKLMTAPLMEMNRIIGVMAIWRFHTEQAFTTQEQEFMQGLARQASIAIQNANLFGQAHAARKEAEEANRVKSRFLANMSHELRTPLNSINNFTFLMLQGTEGTLSEGQHDLLTRIEDSGNHLLSLINDILDLAKIEAGHMDLFIEMVDIGILIDSAAATIREFLKGKPVELIIPSCIGIPPAQADRVRIRQVLINVLSNAAKFTMRGKIEVSVSHSGSEIIVCISDTGIGMRSVDLERAFSEFAQIDSLSDKTIAGSGLGLSISRKFVELHGGRMWATSKPGNGSTFYFTLPALVSR